MREITTHQVNPANDKLRIHAADEPGSGGANHLYLIDGFQLTRSAAGTRAVLRHDMPTTEIALAFQNGPIAEVGVNGITHEALLAILIDRLEGFQAGPYNCEENLQALHHLREAAAALKSRTLARMARGVEGTHEV